MDKTIIKDLVVRGIIGIEDWERKKPQEILINIVLYSDQSNAAETDDIDDCVNYRTVAKKAARHAETAKRLTVEALAADIATLCLDESHVRKVIVRVEKPGAVRFAKSVGVEIERSN